MGFSFNFFGNSEHRVFNYKPMYYDPEKEERRRIFGDVDGSRGKEEKDADGNRKAGSHIRGSFREGNYQQTRQAGGNRVQKIIGIVGLLLFFVILYYIAQFYGYILK